MNKDRQNNRHKPKHPLWFQEVDMTLEQKEWIRQKLRTAMSEEEREQTQKRSTGKTGGISVHSLQKTHNIIKNVLAGAAAVLMVGGIIAGVTHLVPSKSIIATKQPSKPSVATNTVQSNQTQTKPATTNTTTTHPSSKPKVTSYDPVQMVSPKVGWARVNDHLIAVTRDDKKTWTFVTPPGITSKMVVRVDGISVESAVAFAYQTKTSANAFHIYVTSDDGRHWTDKLMKSSATSRYLPMALDFINPKVGWLTVQTQNNWKQGFEVVTLYGTQDGGKSWHIISKTGKDGLPTNQQIANVRFVTPKIGWTTSLSFGELTKSSAFHIGKAYVYKTVNGGVTWKKVTLPVPATLKKKYINAAIPVFTTPMDGTCTITYAKPVPPDVSTTTQKMTFKTTDGGKTWIRM